MPTLRQWEYFVRIVDEGSFSAAADELQVSQPGLSQQLRVLERELGGAVLDRLPRAVVLTPLGRAILPNARAIVSDARRALDLAASVVQASEGSIDVVTITSIGVGVLPGVLKEWLRDHPRTRINVIEHPSVDAAVAAMHAGAGDVAIAPMPSSWHGPHRLIGHEEFVVVTENDHHLAGRNRVDLAAFADEPWVQFTTDHGLSGVLDRYAAEAGFSPQVALRTSQTAAVPRYAEAGVGVGLVPGNILDAGYGGAIVRLAPARRRAIHAFTRAEPGALISEFIDAVAQHADLAGPE